MNSMVDGSALAVPVPFEFELVIDVKQFGHILAAVDTAGQDPVKRPHVEDRSIPLHQPWADRAGLDSVIAD